MRARIKRNILMILLIPAAAFAAWEKVPIGLLPDYQVSWMAFANPNLGYISAPDLQFGPYNFYVYQDGVWRDLHLPGMFMGGVSDISLYESGYGWLCGMTGGMAGYAYTARSRGGGVWEDVYNPWRDTPCAAFLVQLSLAEKEHVYFYDRKNAELRVYDRGDWGELEPPFPNELGDIYDLYFFTPGEGWAGGRYGFAHYENSKWEFIYLPGSGVRQMDFTAPDDGWASSFSSGSPVYHWDGGNWSAFFSVPGYSCIGVSFCDGNNGWATFGGSEKPPKLFKYEYGVWREVQNPGDYVLTYPCTLSPNEAWFVSRENAGQGYTQVTWHWYTEENVERRSLGKIKAAYR